MNGNHMDVSHDVRAMVSGETPAADVITEWKKARDYALVTLQARESELLRELATVREQIREVAPASRSSSARAYSPPGVHLERVRKALNERPGMSLPELHEATGINPHSLSVMVRRWKLMKLIVCKGTRRSYRYYLP